MHLFTRSLIYSLAVLAVSCAADDTTVAPPSASSGSGNSGSKSSLELSGSMPAQLPGQSQKILAYLKKQNSREFSREYLNQQGIYSASFPNRFGSAIAVSGDYMAIASYWGGATLRKDGREVCANGSVDTYKKRGGRWDFLATLDVNSRGPHKAHTCSNFGFDLALDGRTLVITDSDPSLLDQNINGRVAIYELDQSDQWKFKQFLLADPYCGQRLQLPDKTVVCSRFPNIFGFKVALKDNLLAVSQPGTIDIPGFLFIYERESSGSWKRAHKFTSPIKGPTGVFGVSLEVGTNLIVASDVDGTMAVFEKARNVWTKSASLSPHYGFQKTPDYWQFGYASMVAVNGQTVVVGAIADKTSHRGVFSKAPFPAADTGLPGSGAAFIFTKKNNSWIQTHYLKPDDAIQNQFFGGGIAMDDKRLIIGSHGRSKAAKAFYVYNRDGENLVLKSIIRAPESSSFYGSIERGFGGKVVLAGGEIIVSDTQEMSGQRTNRYDGSVNTDATIFADGAVYVYGER